MAEILYFLVELCPFALVLCSGCLLSLWLVFGSTHLLLRMPLFLMGTLALGAVLGSVGGYRSLPVFLLFRAPVPASGLLAGMFLAASFSPSAPWFVRILAVIPGGSFMLAILLVPQAGNLDASWIVRCCIAATFFALVTWGLRFLGLRVVRPAEGISDRELEMVTGKDLDEWLAVLDRSHAESWEPAQIAARVREYGVDFRYQKAILSAYLWSVGRHGLSLPDGLAEASATRGKSNGWETASDSYRPKFTIWQLLLTTFCAACLCGFLRLFGWHRPTVEEDVRYVIPAACALTLTALGAGVGRLAIRPTWRQTGFLSAMIVGVMLLLPSGMGITTWRDWRNLVIAAISLVFITMWTLVLTLVRQRGYRTVWN